ncbi:hypothetical protein TNCV_488641 [Trichonephila clavipes]|nr:hypothetical protein TNCV_488641 [Trichonephila clavipes]
MALARQLKDGYSSRKRKGHPAKKCAIADDVPLAIVRNQYQRCFPIIDDVEDVAERDKKRRPATCVQNGMSLPPLCIATCFSSFHGK